MGRGPHFQKKEQMKVKSVRLSDSELDTIQVFMDSEDCPQSEAIRLLIHYGILYYTTNVLE